MGNMKLYNTFRAVPDTAKKQIGAGRLKGMTDINPMWRIKALTEQFGACGLGWKVVIDKQWTELCGETIQCHCNVSLYIKQDGEWSDAICGTGGSQILAKESKGLYSDDEGYKKAFTDAFGSACKLLGIGADVYWNKDNETKYPTAVKEEVPNDIPPEVKKEVPNDIPPEVKKEVPKDLPPELDFIIEGIRVADWFKVKELKGVDYHEWDCYKNASEPGKKAIEVVSEYTEKWRNETKGKNTQHNT